MFISSISILLPKSLHQLYIFYLIKKHCNIFYLQFLTGNPPKTILLAHFSIQTPKDSLFHYPLFVNIIFQYFFIPFSPLLSLSLSHTHTLYSTPKPPQPLQLSLPSPPSPPTTSLSLQNPRIPSPGDSLMLLSTKVSKSSSVFYPNLADLVLSTHHLSLSKPTNPFFCFTLGPEAQHEDWTAENGACQVGLGA
jgi:hypothetical protein